MPWQSITIMWDGIVVPCCFDFNKFYPLGDANKESLLDIWQGDKMRNLREELCADTDIITNKLCVNCSMGGRKNKRSSPAVKEGDSSTSIAPTLRNNNTNESEIISIAGLTRKISELEKIRVEMSCEIAVLNGKATELEEMTSGKAVLLEENDRPKIQVEALVLSTSWRITKPIRFLKRLFCP